MADAESVEVLVQVVPVESGREISWGSNQVEPLASRMQDIREAIATGARTVADSLVNLPLVAGWEVKEVSGTFGISLSAEAGVILTKASAETTIEVSIIFAKKSEDALG